MLEIAGMKTRLGNPVGCAGVVQTESLRKDSLAGFVLKKGALSSDAHFQGAVLEGVIHLVAKFQKYPHHCFVTGVHHGFEM